MVAADSTSLADSRWTLRRPLSSTGPWPCQAVTSASSAAVRSALSGAAPAGVAQARSTRVRTARGSAASPATSSSVPGSSSRTAAAQASSAARSSAQQLGGAGQGRGHAALQHVLEQGQHLVPQPHAGEAPGRRCAGPATPAARGRRRPPGSWPGRRPGTAGGSGRRRPACRRSSAGPSRGPVPAARSRPGRRACGRAGRTRPARPRRRRGRRSGRRGRRPRDRRPCPRRRARPRPGRGPARSRAPPPAAACTSEPGCSPWSTVTSPAASPGPVGDERGGRGQGERVRPARAGHEDPSRRRQPGQDGPDGAAHLRATAGAGPMCGSGVDAGDPALRIGDLGLGRQRLRATSRWR